MMVQPLVSLCIPTFNRASALRESWKDIAGQDYDRLEIIISDNGSTDDTEVVCRGLADADPRVRYIRHPRNIGLYQNHNFLLNASRGEFLCFVHDHDTRRASITSDYVSFMRQHPDVGVVCADWDVIDESGTLLGVREFDVAPVTSGREFIERTIRSPKLRPNTSRTTKSRWTERLRTSPA